VFAGRLGREKYVVCDAPPDPELAAAIKGFWNCAFVASRVGEVERARREMDGEMEGDGRALERTFGRKPREMSDWDSILAGQDDLQLCMRA
jgi:hypothetical protein